MHKSKYRKRNDNVVLLVAVLLFISVGFALLNSNLSILGTTKVSSTRWDVHWANLSVAEGSVTGSGVTTPASIKTGNTEVEFSITLNKPGEYYEFTVDAVNQGTLDAMINSVTNKIYESNGTTEKTLPAYLNYTVTYNDGIPLDRYHKLAAGTTEKIKVRVEFKKDVTATQLPSTEEITVFKLSAAYIQADNNAIDRPVPTYKYSVSDTTFNIGSAIPNGETTYDNYTDAITAFGHDFFTRHLISGGVITESYVGFVKGNNVYYLQGGIDESSESSQPVYDSNKATLLSAFDNENCSEYVDGDYKIYSCSAGGLSANADLDGYVSAGGESNTNTNSGTSLRAHVYEWRCVVSDDGSSNCAYG